MPTDPADAVSHAQAKTRIARARHTALTETVHLGLSWGAYYRALDQLDEWHADDLAVGAAQPPTPSAYATHDTTAAYAANA